MAVTTIQVNCPSCNAAQAQTGTGQYECEYCLQPFTAVDAQREESRLQDEIKAWIDQRIGAAGAAPGNVDAASRAFIFREKMLPDLRRDVDRTLELLGPYGQFPLVSVPVRTDAPGTGVPNPLLAQRQQIIGFKGLRARLTSDNVKDFALGDGERASVQSLDRRVADALHLSNVVEAAARRDQSGYAAARRNLESLTKELGESLAVESRSDPSFTAYLGGLQTRYQALAELCRTCEELSATSYVDADSCGARLDQISGSLQDASKVIESSNYSPADSMPIVMGINAEVNACSLLSRWVSAYNKLGSRRQISFAQFMQQIDPLTLGGHIPADRQANLLEAFVTVTQAASGAVACTVVNDFTWTDSWAEGARKKKSLGLFGAEESLRHLQRFFVPVWVAAVRYSVSAGAVFASGQERQCVTVVDACAPTVDGVLVIKDQAHPLATAIAYPQQIGSMPVALPRSDRGTALSVMQQAVHSRPDFLNPVVEIRGLGFLAAAVASYQSSSGQNRQLVSCLSGMIKVDQCAIHQVQAAQQLFEMFG